MSRSYRGHRKPSHLKVICPSRKIGFTKGEAERRLAAYQEHPGSRRDAVQRIYHCPLCDHWHLTSQPDRRQP